jgi:hypothetical protein
VITLSPTIEKSHQRSNGAAVTGSIDFGACCEKSQAANPDKIRSLYRRLPNTADIDTLSIGGIE